MTEKEKKIAKIRETMSYLAFADRLSKEDSEALDKLGKEFDELNKDREGWIVEVTYKDDRFVINNEPMYLTNDSSLCFSDDVTCFESKEEAEEYLDKAKLNKDKYNIRIKYYGKEEN